jgi:DNA (cytosine-5)-methyltransferase 1
MLILSLFPGIDLLGMAFELEGFCVVKGPDVIWGGDVRKFHPPAGRFDGILGGPPCQSFSAAGRMSRAAGKGHAFGNLIPEFERCVLAAQPDWFVMENVVGAPTPEVEGYGVHSFRLDNCRCFDESGKVAEQRRVRQISFGRRGPRQVLCVETSALSHPTPAPTVLAKEYGKAATVTVRKLIGKNNRDWSELCRLQGLPEDFDVPGFTRVGKGMAIGNGVPIPMGRAIARAVVEAVHCVGARRQPA